MYESLRSWGSGPAVIVEELLVVALVTWMWAAPRSLHTQTTAHGLMSLAFARTPSRARQIRDQWERSDRLGTARWTLAHDVGLIVLYSASLLIGALLAARLAEATGHLKDEQAAAGFVSGIVPVVAFAAVFDLLKNGGCLLMLKGRATPWVTAATWNFAVVKFALITTAGVGVLGLAATAILVELF